MPVKATRRPAAVSTSAEGPCGIVFFECMQAFLIQVEFGVPICNAATTIAGTENKFNLLDNGVASLALMRDFHDTSPIEFLIPLSNPCKGASCGHVEHIRCTMHS
jgi:hypothetical protein